MTHDALEYAQEIAPDDVRFTLAWLEDAGFNLSTGVGGSTEPFGNVCLDFVGPANVRVVRDRSQWDVTVGPTGGTRRYGLAVLDAARQQRSWEPPDPGQERTPETLPPGLVWSEVVPVIVKWIGEPGSLEAAERTDQAARQRMAEHLGLS